MNPSGKSVFIVVREDGTLRRIIRTTVIDGDYIPENWIEITDSKDKEILKPESIDQFLYTEDAGLPSDKIKAFDSIWTATKPIVVVESPATPFDPSLIGKTKPTFSQKETIKVNPTAYTKKYSKLDPPKPKDGVTRKIYKKPKFKIVTDKTTVTGDGVDAITVSVQDVPSAYTKVKLKVGGTSFDIDPVTSSVQLTFNTPQETQIEAFEPRLVADPVRISVV